MREAGDVYAKHESRDVFYRVAIDVLRLVHAGETALTTAEALAVLLQTWNRSYFRFRGGFNSADFTSLAALVEESHGRLSLLGERSIETFSGSDQEEARTLFGEFETVLGPVGAAKALHLLAPNFFPIWDRKIARGYRLGLKPVAQGGNAGRYVTFMSICQAQSRRFKALGCPYLLKRLDEYNYCVFTKQWIQHAAD